MCKLTVIITFKGKQYIHTFEDDKVKMNYTIYVLLGSKNSKNDFGLARYHYVCKLYNGSMLIPETSIYPEESAYINIKLVSDEFGKYLRKDWKLPLHAIGCNDYIFTKDFNCSIEL